MDHISIPSFALLRYGTVIVRLRMEKFFGHFWESCHQATVRPKSRVVHRVTTCERCTRTRLLSQCSDCDSGLMGKCRPYRTRAAKSRNVNVCAAVCLLLLVGGLTPQSSAAPSRTRRAMAQHTANEEDRRWSNPCGYDDTDTVDSKEYEPILAKYVADQAVSLLNDSIEFKNKIAALHSYTQYELLAEDWKDTDWLRNFSWTTEDVLPKGTEYGKRVDTTRLKLMTSQDLDQVLPLIAKAMKMLGRSLLAVSKVLSPSDRFEAELQPKLENMSNGMRYVLCVTFDLLRARRLELPPVYDSDVPKIPSNGVTTNVFLIYRDSINFLHYVNAFFAEMSLTVPE